MWSTISLSLLLPGPLWLRVVVPIRASSMSQIELFNLLLYLKPFNCVQTRVCLKMLPKNYLLTNYISSFNLIEHSGILWYYSFTTPSWPLVSWLPHVSTGLSLVLSTPTFLSDPRKEKMDEVQSMKVGIRVGEKEKLPSKFKKMTKIRRLL